ncbi:hypothetical protein M569_07913, partial [Genlisea aurea]
SSRAKEPGQREEEDDIVCLDESFFINDGYELTRFVFGSHVLDLFCLQSASTDFDLTGQLVWPGAELLNDYLSKNSDILHGCSVIELGSGVGITGLLCSRFCREVLMTDHNEEILKILKMNIELHESPEDYLAALRAAKLEWGNTKQLDDILLQNRDGFDLVLGADIYILTFPSFQQSNVPLLFDTVEKLLSFKQHKKNNCKFLLAYVSRAKLMDTMVLNEAAKHGLSVHEVTGTRATIRNLEGVIYEIT